MVVCHSGHSLCSRLIFCLRKSYSTSPRLHCLQFGGWCCTLTVLLSDSCISCSFGCDRFFLRSPPLISAYSFHPLRCGLCVGVGRAEGFVRRKGAWKAGEVASTFTDLGSQRGHCICFTSNQDKLSARRERKSGRRRVVWRQTFSISRWTACMKFACFHPPTPKKKPNKTTKPWVSWQYIELDRRSWQGLQRFVCRQHHQHYFLSHLLPGQTVSIFPVG